MALGTGGGHPAGLAGSGVTGGGVGPLGGGPPGGGVGSPSAGMSGEGDWGVQISDALGGFWGGVKGAVTSHSDEAKGFAPIMGDTPYGHGAQLGHLAGLVFGAFTLMGGNPLGMKGMATHGENLGIFSGSTGGLTGQAPGDFGGTGGPSETLGAPGDGMTDLSKPLPSASIAAPTPYTETKEYLGAQKQISDLQAYIGRLGGELEALGARRQELDPKRRQMVGRIPLVHTELGSREPRALTPQKREGMLMSHGVPERGPRK